MLRKICRLPAPPALRASRSRSASGMRCGARANCSATSRSRCCLPDVLVQHERGCLAQMIDAARELGERANIVAVEEVPLERIDQYGVVGVGEKQGQGVLDHEHGGKAAARARAVEPDPHRPLHPAARNSRSAGKAGPRRRRRDPAHRRHDRAVANPSLLRPEVRRAAASIAARRSASSPPTCPTRWRATTSRRASATRSRKSSASSRRLSGAEGARRPDGVDRRRTQQRAKIARSYVSAASAGRAGSTSPCKSCRAR